MTNELTEKFVPGDELELRFYLDSRNPNRQSRSSTSSGDAKLRVRDILTDRKYQVSHTIDIYTSNNRRKQLNFPSGGAQTAPVYMTKKTTTDSAVVINEFGGYRCALARETKTKEFVLQNVEATRIKVRASVIYDDWRLDITLVKNATVQNVSALRAKMIQPIVDFIKDAPFDLCDWIEFEFEYIGDKTPVIDIAKFYRILMPKYNWEYHNSLASIAKAIHHHDAEKFAQIGQGTGFVYLLPKAREVTYDEYRNRFGKKIKSMIIRDKIEGVRKLVWIKDGRIRALDAIGFDDAKTAICGEYIFDCELYEGVYYVLHALVWNCMKIGIVPDDERLKYLDDLVKLEDKRFQICPWTRGTDLVEWWNRKTPYTRDGLLLATNSGYWNQEVIKWKPLSTIDFLAVECPKELEGKSPFVKSGGTLHLLLMGSTAKVQRDHIKQQVHKMFVGHRGAYQPQLFEPVNRPLAYIWEYPKNLHGEIVELKWVDGWQLERVRTDKVSIIKGGLDVGNSAKTVMDTWTKIHKPFTIEMLRAAEQDVKKEEKNIDDLLEKVPNDGRVLLYKTDFIPHGFKKIVYVANQQEFLERQREIETHMKSSIVKFVDSESKVCLPADFIGGSPLTISNTTDSKMLDALTAYGGYLILLSKMVGKYPGMTVIESGETYTILQRENHGRADMTPAEIHKENPHLLGCKEPSFGFKFMRQKTKDIPTLTIKTDECKTLAQNPARGELLCDIEFLSQLVAGSQVYYHNLNNRPYHEQLKKLFPEIKWIDIPTKENVEYLISHTEYDLSEKMVENWNPVQSFIRLNIAADNKQYFRGKMFLIPYANSSDVMLQFSRQPLKQHILKTMFDSEMNYYQRVYRCSGFKYHPSKAGYDNCYDCRSEIYIIGKYIRSQKNASFDATIAVIGKNT